MIRNYILTAWRNITRSKMYSLIHIGGLAVGMAVSILLLIYVADDYNYDKFHENYDQLYEVYRHQTSDAGINTGNSTPPPLAAAITKDFPEIENVARRNWGGYGLLSYGEKAVRFKGNLVDNSFLHMFSFQFVRGDAASAFKELNSIVLTETAAKKLFGNEEAFNKIVKFNNDDPMRVSAIVKELPSNSSIKFEYLASWAFAENKYQWMRDRNWGNNSFITYVQLKPTADPDLVNKKLKGLFAKYSSDMNDHTLFLHPISKWHLYSEFKNGFNTGGNIEYVRLFFGLAICILIVACINFMNLSTARSGKRAREVGVRKVVG
ncbi:MAG: ABC transporter permease, partial [Cytophagaceae bacterium]